MNLADKPLKELDGLINESRARLGLDPLGKSKDKATAIARLEKLRHRYNDLGLLRRHPAAATLLLKPELAKLTSSSGRKRKPATEGRRKLFNYPVGKVKPPARGNTKFSQLVDAMSDKEGALFADLMAITMKFTGEKVETTEEMADANREKKNAGEAIEGYTTSTRYRTWKDLNNLAIRHGYGMRWQGGPLDPIFLFERAEDMAEWDQKHRTVLIASELKPPKVEPTEYET